MDFTSDLYADDGDIPSTSTRGTSGRSSDLVNNEELELVRLQERKVSLIAQREELLAEVTKHQQKLIDFRENPSLELKGTEKSKKPVDLVHLPNDPGSLLELFTKTLPIVNSIKRQKKVDEIDVINGNSELEDELAAKYDALPLLNSDLRLKMLRRSCPYMKVELLKPPSVQILYLSETDLDSKFTLGYEVDIDTNNGKVLSLENLKVSDNIVSDFEVLLDYATSTLNIGYLLFGCNEFARLCVSRKTVLSNLKQSVLNSISHIEVIDENEQSIKLAKFAWKIKVEYSISFITETLPSPCSQIFVTLYKNGQKTKSVQDIVNGMIKEYGVVGGIVEFIKSLFI
ncbi:HGL027Wp [Eremothecium sinecaudum]|uniref:HGL027Wp n=1 Tax=Eremothecium sinecaudum TaxID=45286 RepID=A0A0X8HVR8_9SACH|nr:HGL027Wp [Eremothecium sinecaudum]AMD22313.1 HGL027Wp [Eremothecium sinecaudum]